MFKRKLKSVKKVLKQIDQLTEIELEERSNLSELEKIARKESAAYMYEHIAKAVLFDITESYWSFVISNVPETGLLLEFGVYKGRSINYIAEQLKKKNDPRTIYGFDSFEGLSEDWGGTVFTKGTFNISGELPEVLPNVKLIKGLVDATLMPFLDKIDKKDKNMAYIHLDMDVYSPTKYVLSRITPHLKPGTIIDFDDLIGFPGWKEGEYKALKETLNGKCRYEHIAFCENKYGKKPYKGIMKSAIRIIEI